MKPLAAGALIAATGLVAAQQPDGAVRVSLADGRASISAQQATLAQILAEYSRVGGVRIETASPLPRQPISVDLANVSERQAFEVLLRGVGGFVAVPHATAADARDGLSEFARVVIVSMSRPADIAHGAGPAANTAAPPAPQPPSATQAMFPVAPGVNRLLGPDGQPVPDDQADGPIVQQPAAPPAAGTRKRRGGSD
jgi:hypothetical protein